MIEVKRYDMSGYGDGMIEVPDGAFVHIDDYKSQFAALREELDGYRAANMVLRDEVKTERLRGDAAVGDANEAEQRLADAERRNAELKSVDPSKENKLFEAWARTQSSVSLRLCDIGLYLSRETGLAHDAWQYRAALNPKPEAASHDFSIIGTERMPPMEYDEP